MKIFRKQVMAALVSAACAAMKNALPLRRRGSREIIRDMVLDYGYYQEQAEANIEKLLSELEAADADAGARWRRIMTYWKYTAEEMEVHYGTLPDGLENSEKLCLVVLGYELDPDGSLRPELVERLKLTLECAAKYPRAWVLCTGGGTADKAPRATEADGMASWLTENGLDPRRLIVENQSLTTGQNARFTYRLLRREHPEVTAAAIISSDYHVRCGAALMEAESILKSRGEQELRVVASAGCRIPEHEEYGIEMQAGGMLELARQDDLALKIYYHRLKTPTLK